jgi:aryl-alcohol dehydrogenase-like predicted oxidoreductase
VGKALAEHGRDKVVIATKADLGGPPAVAGIQLGPRYERVEDSLEG